MRWTTKNENMICEELNDGALLVDAKTGQRWVLNKAAAAKWKLNDMRMSFAEFCEQLQSPALYQAAGGIPTIKTLGLGTGPRRRPSPRGNSGPG